MSGTSSCSVSHWQVAPRDDQEHERQKLEWTLVVVELYHLSHQVHRIARNLD